MKKVHLQTRFLNEKAVDGLRTSARIAAEAAEYAATLRASKKNIVAHQNMLSLVRGLAETTARLVESVEAHQGLQALIAAKQAVPALFDGEGDRYDSLCGEQYRASKEAIEQADKELASLLFFELH